MHQGIESLMQKNHIDIFNGTGRIMGTSIFSPQSGTISVEYDNVESELLPNQNVLIATGSLPTQYHSCLSITIQFYLVMTYCNSLIYAKQSLAVSEWS